MTEEIKLSANAQKAMDLIEGLSILELDSLVKSMETKFWISAAAPVSSSQWWANAWAWSDDVEEKATVNAIITSAWASKIAVIKVIRDLTGLWLWEAKALADNCWTIKENVDRAEWEKIKKALEEAWATVELK